MPLLSLPVELISHILYYALDDHPQPTSVLLVNSIFKDIGQSILHADLRFSTTTQLSLFIERLDLLSCPTRSLSVTLAGGTADFSLFHLLQLVFRRCAESQAVDNEYGNNMDGRLKLKLLRFCLNSHTSDPNLHRLRTALALVKYFYIDCLEATLFIAYACSPEEFIWTGPDPDHHFSIAIVPAATPFLFSAISTWSNLRNLKLTNLAFPSGVTLLLKQHTHTHTLSQCLLSTPPLSNLRTIYLGQIAFLDPAEIARIACSLMFPELQEIKVVDAYRESIWGRRIRSADIEAAALAAFDREGHNVTDLADELDVLPSTRDRLVRIRRLVRCEAKTERIMGGDRVEVVGM